MPDIFFKCETCGKNLVSDDVAEGMTTTCPECKASTTVPELVIVHPCPQCGQVLKFTREMKGELVDCSSCNSEALLPGWGGAHGKHPHPFVCPKCNAELEALDEVAQQLVTCPNCDERVRLRPKLLLKTDVDSLVPASDSRQFPSDAAPAQRSPRQIRLSTLLRYGVVDLLLLVLFLIPLPALNGHNFFYILALSISGSQSSPLQQGQSKPSDSRLQEPLHSQAWTEGYDVGQTYARMDRDSGTDDHKNPNFASRAKIAPWHSAGTPEYSDFWDGYRQGYAERRQLGVPTTR